LSDAVELAEARARAKDSRVCRAPVRRARVRVCGVHLWRAFSFVFGWAHMRPARSS